MAIQVMDQHSKSNPQIDMHGIEILTTKNQSYSKEIQQLKEENLRLRIVNEYVKKLSALDQEDQKK